MSSSLRRVDCPSCGYAIVTYAESLEAVENGGKCLLCGGLLDLKRLTVLVDSWTDAEVLAEAADRADAEDDLADEDLWLDAGPDFGDEGDDEEDDDF